MSFTGGCLCGTVRYQCSVEPLHAGHCQCGDCRRSSGSGHISSLIVARDGVDLQGAVTSHDKATDTGQVLSRAFCPVCGSPLYSIHSARPDLIALRASTLDDPEIFRPRSVIFTASAPSWDHIDPALPGFPGMPPPPVAPAGG